MTPTAMAPGAKAERPGADQAPGAADWRDVEAPPSPAPERGDGAPPSASRRVRLFSLIALVAVAAAASLAFLPGGTLPVVPARALETLPRALGEWREVTPPPGTAMATDPGVTHDVSRTYERGGASVWLSIGYYAVLAPGRHPDVQRLVMPGSGYVDLSARSIQIPLGGETLPANLIVMRAADRTLSTVYWYHLGGRGVASDHGYRALLLWNRLWRHRSNVAVVRVVSPVAGDDAERALAAQADFVRALYPELRRSLPD